MGRGEGEREERTTFPILQWRISTEHKFQFGHSLDSLFPAKTPWAEILKVNCKSWPRYLFIVSRIVWWSSLSKLWCLNFKILLFIIYLYFQFKISIYVALTQVKSGQNVCSRISVRLITEAFSFSYSYTAKLFTQWINQYVSILNQCKQIYCIQRTSIQRKPYWRESLAFWVAKF